MQLCPLQKYVQALTPCACECDLIWKLGLCRYSQVNTRSEYIKMGSNPFTVVLEKQNFDTGIQGRGTCDDEAEGGMMHL